MTPVHWYQSPSVLKLMIDRLVCADGGNPDPTSTSGKNADESEGDRARGWPYPKHLAGRVYGLIVHGDVAGIEYGRALCRLARLDGAYRRRAKARLDRFIGYYEPYATSHEALDKDKAMLAEAANVTKAVAQAVAELRAGKLPQPDSGFTDPRPK